MILAVLLALFAASEADKYVYALYGHGGRHPATHDLKWKSYYPVHFFTGDDNVLFVNQANQIMAALEHPIPAGSNVPPVGIPVSQVTPGKTAAMNPTAYNYQLTPANDIAELSGIWRFTYTDAGVLKSHERIAGKHGTGINAWNTYKLANPFSLRKFAISPAYTSKPGPIMWLACRATSAGYQHAAHGSIFGDALLDDSFEREEDLILYEEAAENMERAQEDFKIAQRLLRTRNRAN